MTLPFHDWSPITFYLDPLGDLWAVEPDKPALRFAGVDEYGDRWKEDVLWPGWGREIGVEEAGKYIAACRTTGPRSKQP